MTENKTLTGGCLCGAVRFTAAPREREYGACHCDSCRRWAGGPFMAIPCGRTLKIEGDAQLGVYRSSKWAERMFCKKCGTSLFLKLTGNGHCNVSIEAFDDNADFEQVVQYFIDEKPAHYAFVNDTKKMTGAELYALFAGPDATQGS